MCMFFNRQVTSSSSSSLPSLCHKSVSQTTGGSIGLAEQILEMAFVNPLKTIPDFRPQWVTNLSEKSIADFRPKRRKHHTLWDAHTYRASIGEHPPPSPNTRENFLPLPYCCSPRRWWGDRGYFFGGGASLAWT